MDVLAASWRSGRGRQAVTAARSDSPMHDIVGSSRCLNICCSVRHPRKRTQVCSEEEAGEAAEALVASWRSGRGRHPVTAVRSESPMHDIIGSPRHLIT